MQAWEQKVRSTKPVLNRRVQFKRSTAYYTEDASPFAPRPSKRARTCAGADDVDIEYVPQEEEE